MSLEQILILSFIQGITEFLPISSSGHLALAPILFGWKDQGLVMDVAAHIGTLGSVLLYFRRDVMCLFKGSFDTLLRRKNQNTRLLWNLVIATIPAVITGIIFELYIGSALRSVTVIAWMGIIFGIILYIADRMGKMTVHVEDTGVKGALYFGLAQSLALINGVSRSGTCITMGRFMNYTRVDAARFAFLMSIPTITAAGTLKTYQLFRTGDLSLLSDAISMIFFSFISGFLAIAFMMRWLRKSSLTPFVIYRLCLGVLLLWGTYSGFIT